jgi:hypothetical protein
MHFAHSLSRRRWRAAAPRRRCVSRRGGSRTAQEGRIAMRPYKSLRKAWPRMGGSRGSRSASVTAISRAEPCRLSVGGPTRGPRTRFGYSLFSPRHRDPAGAGRVAGHFHRSRLASFETAGYVVGNVEHPHDRLVLLAQDNCVCGHRPPFGLIRRESTFPRVSRL